VNGGSSATGNGLSGMNTFSARGYLTSSAIACQFLTSASLVSLSSVTEQRRDPILDLSD